MSSADYLELPRTAAAIDAGLVDEAFILAGFASFDKNANDVVCVQLSNGFETNNRPFGEYLYNVTDDTARAHWPHASIGSRGCRERPPGSCGIARRPPWPPRPRCPRWR